MVYGIITKKKSFNCAILDDENKLKPLAIISAKNEKSYIYVY